MSDIENKTLQITSGSVRLDPKAITAHGKEKSRLTATWFAGLAVLMLIILYGIGLFVKGADTHELLPVIGTVFGLFIGRFGQRGD